MQPACKVTLRVVQMYQNGELDPAVAMSLLGSGILPGSGVKRPLEPSTGGGDSDKPEDSPVDLAAVDELLQNAKRAKNESLMGL